MARTIGVNNLGRTTARLYVTELITTASYASIYIYCNGYKSPNLARNGFSTSLGWDVPNLSCGTYYPTRYEITSSGGSSDSGSSGFSTLDCAAPVRPDSWYWDYSKVPGQALYLTASEWNDFCSRINEFRRYKGYGSYSFTTVYSGNTITASQLNQAVSAISTLTSTPSSVSSGGTANASFLNGLQNSLNSIT